jgi:hypothetical protein
VKAGLLAKKAAISGVVISEMPRSSAKVELEYTQNSWVPLRTQGDAWVHGLDGSYFSFNSGAWYTESVRFWVEHTRPSGAGRNLEEDQHRSDHWLEMTSPARAVPRQT